MIFWKLPVINQNPFTMKKLTLLTVVLVAICSCTQQVEPPTKEVDETGDKNMEIVKKLFAAQEAKNVDAMREIFAQDAIVEGPNYGSIDTMNAKAFAGQEKWLGNLDSLNYRVIAIMPHSVEEGNLAGEWVMVWAVASWYNIEAEKKVSIYYHAPIQIKDGKIVYMASYWNQWDLYKQLGATLEWDDDEDDE